jgi:hypothetical protein
MKNTAKECAFCSGSAKISGEHVVSRWISKSIFPGLGKHRIHKHNSGEVKEWIGKGVQWQLKVVCTKCNNEWMSRLEDEHAKPRLTPLIKGSNIAIPIDLEYARSIALFAFKTALVVDQIQYNASPFFSKEVRSEFRKCLAIPLNVSMWMFAVDDLIPIAARFLYYGKNLSLTEQIKLYTITFAIGKFGFQVVSIEHPWNVDLSPIPGFEHLSIPFWPRLPFNVVWPPLHRMKGAAEFSSYSNRWASISIADV